MINTLKNIYKKEQFNPLVFGIITNPFYFARRGLYNNIMKLTHHLDGKLLDVGCGTKPYENICDVEEYIGVEIENEANKNNQKVDYFYDGKTLPFKSEFFDSIITNQVFEHVFNPHAFLKEINRVTKMGGQMLMTVPFVWDEHEQPFDYARYSFFGLKHVLAAEGFEVIESRKSNNGISAIFQLLNAYIYKITLTKFVFINLFFTIILMAPINILGLIFSLILPKNNDLYLDNIILARKVRNA